MQALFLASASSAEATPVDKTRAAVAAAIITAFILFLLFAKRQLALRRRYY
jgi:hypothetical protein